MEIKRADFWEAITGAESYESFQENILEEIYLNPKIDSRIKEEIETVKKLLLHSYYEYSFFDTAFTQIIICLEKVLKTRLKEVKGVLHGKSDFFHYINWFYENGFFETNRLEFIQWLRDFRNRKVHSPEKLQAGWFSLSTVYRTIDLINDVYEDLELRKERNIIEKESNEKLKLILENGAISTVIEKREIFFQAWIYFIDNKSASKIMSLVLWPIFNPQPYREDKHPIPRSYFLEVYDWKFEPGLFTAKEVGTEKKLNIVSIDDQANKEKFENWDKEIRNLKDYPIVRSLANSPLEDYFSISLRKFHRKG
jgi:hypothetical protein